MKSNDADHLGRQLAKAAILLALILAWGGTVHSLSGQATLRSAVFGSAEQRLGRVLKAGGDLNGDGVVDLLVGAPGGTAPLSTYTAGTRNYNPVHNSPNVVAGQAFALNGVNGSTLWASVSPVLGDRRGTALCVIGDHDGDGVRDVAVGVPFASFGPQAQDIGRIDLLSGQTGSLISSISIPMSDHWLWGRTICNVGDRNGDGFDDIAAGLYTPYIPVTGLNSPCGSTVPTNLCPRTVIVSSVSGAILVDILSDPSVPYPNNDTQYRHPNSLESIPDINGDGFPEIVEGSPYNPNIAVRSGWNGALVLSSWSVGHLSDTHPIASPGDLNADGVADIVHGVLGGTVDAVSGVAPQGNPLAGTVLWQRTVYSSVTASSWFFGQALAAAGDINGDGVNDIVVGNPGRSEELLGVPAPSAAGEVYVLSGADGTILDRIVAPALDTCFGAAVAALGDVNGDGIEEIAVGAYLDGTGGTAAGAVYIYSLNPLATDLAGGTVGAGAGGPFDVLTVNGEAGGSDRIVDIGVSSPIAVSIGAPISTGFGIWGSFGLPQSGGVVPTSSGTFVFPPQPLSPWAPWLFTLSNNLWNDPTAILPSGPGPWSFAFPPGIPLPLDLTLQGLFVASGSGGPSFEITNALALRVR